MMFHEDGIEVYVRIANSKRQHGGGYKEYAVCLKDDHEGHRQRCLVDHRQGKVEVTYEFAPHFDMHGASALHLGFHAPNRNATCRGDMRYIVRHASDLQQHPVKVRLRGETVYQMAEVDAEKSMAFPLVEFVHTD